MEEGLAPPHGVEGLGEELEEYAAVGVRWEPCGSRSGTQGPAGSGKAQGSWFRSNEIRRRAHGIQPAFQAQRPGSGLRPGGRGPGGASCLRDQNWILWSGKRGDRGGEPGVQSEWRVLRLPFRGASLPSRP